MKDIIRRNAGFGAVLLGLLLVFVMYILCGTVDLVFMKGDLEVAHMDNVNVFSSLELNPEDVFNGEELTYIYESGDEIKTYEANATFRLEIAKTVAHNLVSPFVQKTTGFIVKMIPDLAKPLSKFTEMKPIDPIVLTAQ